MKTMQRYVIVVFLLFKNTKKYHLKTTEQFSWKQHCFWAFTNGKYFKCKLMQTVFTFVTTHNFFQFHGCHSEIHKPFQLGRCSFSQFLKTSKLRKTQLRW